MRIKQKAQAQAECMGMGMGSVSNIHLTSKYKRRMGIYLTSKYKRCTGMGSMHGADERGGAPAEAVT